MAGFEDASAIVTGAASGIGLALSRALIERGAHVWLSDVDGGAAKAAAETLGPRAHAEALDVRDAAGFDAIVARVASERSGLDYLFNNAGIGVGGEAHESSAAHYDRTIDINIRGVTNGVAAAYPRMVARGSGHIVNTASAAGLLPVPLLAAYAMSKHAVVGLTTSLRLEGEPHGVRFSALCPSAIETPLLDKEGPSDLPRTWRPDLRRYLTRVAGPPYPVEKFVEYALDAVAANRGVIVAPASARAARFLHRIAPGLVLQRIRSALRAERADRPIP
ncbi:MAG: SDR family oxidoreductase [Myxococcales bacterium]|nr:SDR family oxidoreductase [Myxococcales bacterium]